MERPMRDMLGKASKRFSLHMPAVQGRAPFGPVNPYRYDTTELPITDDLYRPTGAIAKAQRLAAQSAGAAHTLMLHGGSTAGIHAMLLYSARRGEMVILPRNAHISTLHLCAVAGLNPVFAEPAYTALGRPYTEAAAYERAMAEYPTAKAVLVLRPDYYGLMPDLPAIARMANAQHMLLLCDEAHGATFSWRKDVDNACACGADLTVQSAHKTLPALTASAWLHASERINIEQLRGVLRMVQTSSPSFVSMLSLDDARAWMDRHGERACERLRESLRVFWEKAATLGYANGQDDAPPGLSYDPLRLVLRAPQGGYVLESMLRSRGIDVEMCDVDGIVAIVSLLDGRARLERLYRALKAIARERIRSQTGVNQDRAMLQDGDMPNRAPIMPPREPPKRALPLSEAAFAPSEPVSIEAAAGRVSARAVGLYPPGVAALTAGEVISSQMMAFLLKTEARHLFGLPGPGSIQCLK